MAKGLDVVKLTFDSVPLVVGGVGVYEGYLFITDTPPVFTPDPVYDFIKKYVIPLLPKYNPTGQCAAGTHYDTVTASCIADVVQCPTGQHRDSSGVCVSDTLPCPTGQQLVGGVCVPIGGADITKPLISIVNPTIGSIITGPTVTINGTASDIGGSGVSQVYVRARPTGSLATTGYIPATPGSPGNWSTWSATISLTALGISTTDSYDIVARADDVAANAGYHIIVVYCPVCSGNPITCPTGTHLVNGICVTDTVVDVIPPTVAITSPIANATAGNNLINVAGTAADAGSGVNAVFVRIANGVGTTWQQATPIAAGNWSSWNITVDLNSLGTPGPYLLEARADDKAGNQTWSTQVSVNYTPGNPITCPIGQHLANGVCVPDVVGDTTLPLLVVTSPANGNVLPGNIVTVTGTAFDAGGVKEVFMRTRPVGSIITTGYVLATPVSPGNWSSWSINVSLTANGISPTGNYEIIGLCRDNALNAANTKTTISCPSCVPAPPTCTPPQVLQNGVCVTPTFNPTATPNKLVYAVNEVMTITGAGFAPNEIVGCRYTSNGVLVLARDVNANASGGFVVTFQATGGGHVTCTGRTSNAVGQTPAITVTGTSGYTRFAGAGRQILLYSSERFADLVTQPYRASRFR